MTNKALDPLASLPPANTQRWVPSLKGAVVAAVNSGALSPQEACERYSLSTEELELWQRAVDEIGLKALRTTRLQQYPHLYKRAHQPVSLQPRQETVEGIPRRRRSM